MPLYDWHLLPPDVTAHSAAMTTHMVAGKQILFIWKHDKLFATAAICPHGGVQLCDGYLDVRGNIVCPLLHYRFDPRNGYNASGEGYKLKTYPIEHRPDGYYLGILQDL